MIYSDKTPVKKSEGINEPSKCTFVTFCFVSERNKEGCIFLPDLEGKYQLIRIFHDKIKFYILRQNLHQTYFNDFSNVK